jgi:hypothetical protein
MSRLRQRWKRDKALMASRVGLRATPQLKGAAVDSLRQGRQPPQRAIGERPTPEVGRGGENAVSLEPGGTKAARS